MASSSSSSSFSITKEEFKAFHKIDRRIFARLVLTLKRDINQSFQVMSFLLFLEKSGLVNNLIANLISFPDFFLNLVADEALMCLSCMSYQDFGTFVANLGENSKSCTIPLIARMTSEFLTLAFIHQQREAILLEMKKHLTATCYPAFDDIVVRAEQMQSNEAGSSSQQGPNKVAASSPEEEQRRTDDRTVFLTFSKGYPISQVEVHAFFTRRFGEIIEAIYMPEVGGEQALFARLVLRSAANVPEIVNEQVNRTKYTINGKHVWARKYVSKTPNNPPPSNGVSL